MDKEIKLYLDQQKRTFERLKKEKKIADFKIGEVSEPDSEGNRTVQIKVVPIISPRRKVVISGFLIE